MSESKKINADVNQIARFIASQMSEVFDSFIVIGFVAGRKAHPIVVSRVEEPAQAMALNLALMQTQIPDKDGPDELSVL